MDGAHGMHDRHEMNTFWSNLTQKDHMDDRGLDERIILIWILKKWDVKMYTGFT
jgi:hypothetical protein